MVALPDTTSHNPRCRRSPVNVHANAYVASGKLLYREHYRQGPTTVNPQTLTRLKALALDAQGLLTDLAHERSALTTGDADKSKLRRVTKRLDYLLGCLHRDFNITTR